MKKIIIALVLLIFLLGCQQPEELTPVKVHLKWLHQAQFTGNYVALEKGFYQENNIKIIELKPYDFVSHPIKAVEGKTYDFGITGADELIIAHSEGRATNVKAIAVIYKTNPVSFYSLPDSNIKKPADFLNKRVGIEKAADGSDINVGILYKAMVNNLNLDTSKIEEITIGFDASELLAGQTDVSAGYIINEPYGVVEAGLQPNIILAADYGVNMYADVIITHVDTINNNPELVQNFVTATLDGWQYAIENEEEAIDIVQKYDDKKTREHTTYMLKQSIPLIHTGNEPIGWMTEKDWTQAVDILFNQEIINTKPENINLYTNIFVENKK